MSSAASGNVDQTGGVASAVARSEPAPRPARTASWALSRLLATLGAILFAYAAWIPWELVTFRPDAGGQAPSLQVAVSLSAATTYRLATITDAQAAVFLTSLLTVLGILLAPLLWRRSDSLLGAIATHLLGIWLLFVTVLAIQTRVVDTAVLRGLYQPAVSGILGVQYQYQAGFWLAVAALALLWIGIALLLFSEWRMHAFWHGWPGLEGDRSRAAIPGTALLVLGLLIWAYGFLFTAWVTFNCSTEPLFFGTCRGMDANGVMSGVLGQPQVARGPLLLAVDPGVARYAISLLLGGGALLVLLGAWQRGTSRTYCLWATLWLLTAVGLGVFAYYGVTLLTAPGAQLPEGVTRVGGAIGIPATFIGLALVLIGLIAFWIAALGRRREE
jgi:hypothetical protein